MARSRKQLNLSLLPIQISWKRLITKYELLVALVFDEDSEVGTPVATRKILLNNVRNFLDD